MSLWEKAKFDELDLSQGTLTAQVADDAKQKDLIDLMQGTQNFEIDPNLTELEPASNVLTAT